MAHSSDHGYPPFAFGIPYKLGTRHLAAGEQETKRLMEPACQSHSSFTTQTDQPETLMMNIKTFTLDVVTNTQANAPTCYPTGETLPDLHKPTVWYTLDSYTTMKADEKLSQAAHMQGVKAIYTRGEGYTVKTDAERTNYLMLHWWMKENNQNVFMKPNTILFEFAGSAMMPIIRLIEAEQNRPECGWAVYCKNSGSCWAKTKLGDDDKCLPEGTVQQELEDHANGVKEDTAWIIYTTIVVFSICGICAAVSAWVYVRKAFKLGKDDKARLAAFEAENAPAEGEGEGEEDGDADADAPDANADATAEGS
jgi:hypothetical protein